MTARRCAPALLAAVALLAVGMPAHAEGDDAREAYLEVCYNYGCHDSALARFDTVVMATLGSRFADVHSPAEERAALARTIAELYRLAGRQTPIAADRAGNRQDEEVNGRMDCIDHTQTITRLLRLFEKRSWLRYHTLAPEPAHRRFLIFDHIAPVLIERADPLPAPAPSPAAPAPKTGDTAPAAATPPVAEPPQGGHPATGEKGTDSHANETDANEEGNQAVQQFDRLIEHAEDLSITETRSGLREMRITVPAPQPAEVPPAKAQPTPAADNAQAQNAYVIDGWLVDFGQEPIILPLPEWQTGGGPNVGY